MTGTHDTLSDRERSGEVERTVFDAELVDGTSLRREWRRRFTDWWQRSSRVPTAVKSWRSFRQAMLDVLVWGLRSPWLYLGAISRGALAAVRSWRQWIRVHDYRDAAEESQKLADKFIEIRALTLFRWKVTGVAGLGVAAAGVVAYAVYGAPALWYIAGIGTVVLAIFGRRSEGSPGRKPVLSGPRTFTWTMDPGVLVDAFRDARVIGKDESLRLVERAARVGDGWAVTVDLPATRKAADVIKHRDALASALAVDEVQLIVERVRGKGGHAGRVFLWVADEDPYSGPPMRFPLLGADRWDAWRSIPFGRDARNRKIDLQLVWTSLLVGAIPRQGKTFATRLPAAGLILDPYTQLYIFDGKGGKDWEAAEGIAHRFVCGDEMHHTEAVRDFLIELVAEVQARYQRMSTLDDDVCPESKITPGISRDPNLAMPITAVIIDEVQVYLENLTQQEVGGKKTTLGAYIADLLTYLARKGPAVGIVVIVATQRPDSTTIPSRLRAVLGTRFALRVMDWRDSNIVLGEQMNTRGFDASALLPSHKGVGILRPDGDTDAGADTVALTVRTYFMANPEWRKICIHGRELRQAAGTLTGHAAGDDGRHAINQAAVANVVGADIADEVQTTDVPEPLASVADYLDDDLDQRDFIPTAELLDALDTEPTLFGRRMGELGCQPRRGRVAADDGTTRQARGYYTADIRASLREQGATDEPSEPN